VLLIVCALVGLTALMVTLSAVCAHGADLIAFTRGEGRAQEIVVYDLETRTERYLTDNDVWDGLPTLSPSGRFLAFVRAISDRDVLEKLDFTLNETDEIIVVNPRSGETVCTGKSDHTEPYELGRCAEYWPDLPPLAGVTNLCWTQDETGILFEAPCSVTRTGNSFVGNLLDLSGDIDPALRPPTRNAYAEAILFPSFEYESLQEAVDALLPGGVLILDEDVWADSAVVDKPLYILAEGSSSIQMWGREARDGERLPVFSFLGPCEVTIERLYLGGGITVGPEIHLTLREVRLPDTPLELSGKAQLLWEGGYGSPSVSGEGRAEVSQVSLSGGPAVAADDLAHVRLVSCKVEGWSSSSWSSAATISVASRAALEIEDCMSRGGSVAYTIECGGWSTTKITSSQLLGARQAVLHLSGPSDVSLKEVTIADSRGAGVLFSGDTHLHLDEVTLEKNALGMTVLNAGCGFEQAGGLFMVQVHPEVEIGAGGISFKDNETDLCPTYPGNPWPEGLLKE